MKKSLLVWGALAVVALCFVGCCYYSTTHNNCPQHCKHIPCCNESGKQCPDAKKQMHKQNNNEVDSVTVEEIDIIPVNNPPANQNPPAKPATGK